MDNLYYNQNGIFLACFIKIYSEIAADLHRYPQLQTQDPGLTIV